MKHVATAKLYRVTGPRLRLRKLILLQMLGQTPNALGDSLARKKVMAAMSNTGLAQSLRPGERGYALCLSSGVPIKPVISYVIWIN